MKCPYCQNEMNPGFIQSRDGLYWTSKKKAIPALNSLIGGGTPLSENGPLGGAAEAYNCPNCKVVIVPYGSFQ